MSYTRANIAINNINFKSSAFVSAQENIYVNFHRNTKHSKIELTKQILLNTLEIVHLRNSKQNMFREIQIIIQLLIVSKIK